MRTLYSVGSLILSCSREGNYIQDVYVEGCYLPCPTYFLGLGLCLLKDFLADPFFLLPNVTFLVSPRDFAFAIVLYFKNFLLELHNVIEALI